MVDGQDLFFCLSFNIGSHRLCFLYEILFNHPILQIVTETTSHGKSLSIGPWRKPEREREGGREGVGVIVSSFHDDLAVGLMTPAMPMLL